MNSSGHLLSLNLHGRFPYLIYTDLCRRVFFLKPSGVERDFGVTEEWESSSKTGWAHCLLFVCVCRGGFSLVLSFERGFVSESKLIPELRNWKGTSPGTLVPSAWERGLGRTAWRGWHRVLHALPAPAAAEGGGAETPAACCGPLRSASLPPADLCAAGGVWLPLSVLNPRMCGEEIRQSLGVTRLGDPVSGAAPLAAHTRSANF